jgi:two-component system sensor histidine kinase TctE
LHNKSSPLARVPSLRRALIKRLLLAVFLTMAASIGILLLQFRSGITGMDDQTIDIQVEALRATLVSTPEGPRLSLPAELRELYEAPGTLNGYQLFDANGALLESGGFAPSFVPLPPHNVGNQAVMQREVDPRTKNGVLTATLTVEDGGQMYWLRVARDLRDLESLAGQLVLRALPEFAPMLIALVITMVGVVIVTVHFSLRPLREVSKQAAGLSGDRIAERLRAERLPREVIPLVQAVNLALDRLEADYKAQRDFTAHAAHELRTPLAILRADLDSRFTPAQLGDVGQEIDSLARVVEQLLCMAQLDSELSYEVASLDAYACAVEVARDLVPRALARQQNLSATTSGASVPTRGNATLIRLVFRNLIENAIQHTPPGTSISVAALDGNSVVIKDDGPGIAPGDREDLFDRFRRGTTAEGPGVGLGLAIAQRVMERAGGRLLLDSQAARGARFVVIFNEITAEHRLKPRWHASRL